MILFSILFALVIANGSTSNPGHFCDQIKTCTKKMESISTSFKNSGIQFANHKLSGYAGECYYLNSPYNPNQTHYSAFLFENDSLSFKADGVFMMHYQSNPFDNYSELELKKEFIRRGYILHPVFLEDNMVRLSVTQEFNYWFRSDESEKKLFMIAQQGGAFSTSLAFCQFDRLKSQ